MSNNGNFALGRFANLGVPSGTWTLGLMIMSQLLWPTELKVHMAGDEGNDPSSFGSKPNVSTCPLIPNIKTALFIQLAATSTVYEDYERNFMPTSSCVASWLCNAISPTRLGLWPIALHSVPLITSATLHYFWLSDYPTFSRTRTRAISFSFRIVGQSF